MQGYNMGRYHPPSSLDPSLATTSSTQGFNRSASGKRIAPSQPTIRFEMPFAIWCTTCVPETIIGQGVRFNAVKTPAGKYHSTTIWSFVMRHGQCGGEIEIRTDPAEGEYVVCRGARRRIYASAEEQAAEKEAIEERERRAAALGEGGDAFAAAEIKIADGQAAKQARLRLEGIKRLQDDRWEDAWSANRRARGQFRVRRKDAERREKNAKEVADRLGLAIPVLDEVEEDGRRARLVDFGTSDRSFETRIAVKATRGLFDDGGRELTLKSGTKKRDGDHAAKLLRKNLAGNTRAVVDPFLNGGFGSSSGTALITGIKRRKIDKAKPQSSREAELTEESTKPTKTSNERATLVSYGSDDSDGK